jgi:DNA-binding response OmpR family regulator
MKNVLVIEDEVDISDLMCMILSDEGYEVTILNCADTYKQQLKQTRPDIVLLDLNIAGFDGSIVCDYIKGQSDLKHIPVILISANRNILEVKEICRADGAIRKPFDVQNLIDTVAMYMKQL